ncbi:MAG: ferredoxin--NADP reductase [Cytophagaceae bacterium]|nr:ferredoxin--NADP reductase [Cytophagaceae bacterium]
MSQYFNLKIREIIKETAEAITLVFEHPGKDKLNYKPGQFLTLILTINGEKIRRSYSLCTAPGVDEFPAVTVKRVANGKVSNYVADKVKIGDSIEVMQPMGTFTIERNLKNKRNIVLIGAGSGITPLMGIAKALLAGEPDSKVYLIYGNRNEDSIIFKKKIEELQSRYASRFFVIHILSQPSYNWNSHKGRLSQSEVIKLLETFPRFDFAAAEYFICGPEGMMDEANKGLHILNVPKDKIRKESFVSSSSPEPSGEVVAASQSNSQEVTIIYQGTEYKFAVPPNKSILEAALDLDIDLPYSCQSGMCTACMGKCVSGKVHLNDPDGLSDKEIQQGFVLTCVGHPVSPNVVIEID